MFREGKPEPVILPSQHFVLVFDVGGITDDDFLPSAANLHGFLGKRGPADENIPVFGVSFEESAHGFGERVHLVILGKRRHPSLLPAR